MYSEELIARLAQHYGKTSRDLWNAPLWCVEMMLALAPGVKEET